MSRFDIGAINIPGLSEKVHREVDELRARAGMPPWDWSRKNNKVVQQAPRFRSARSIAQKKVWAERKAKAASA